MVELNEFGVRSFLDKFAVGENVYPIGVHDGSEAVGDQDDRLARLFQIVYDPLYVQFGFRVECRCRLVENQDRGVFIECTTFLPLIASLFIGIFYWFLQQYCL